MKTLPDLLFIVDIEREDTAVREAVSKEIPVIAMVDTNCNPSDIDYVIPSNDDAIRAIKLLIGHMADAAIEGKMMRKDDEIEEEIIPTRSMISRKIEDEEELNDEDLLGESTRAKIVFEKRADEEVVESTETESETATEDKE